MFLHSNIALEKKYSCFYKTMDVGSPPREHSRWIYFFTIFPRISARGLIVLLLLSTVGVLVL